MANIRFSQLTEVQALTDNDLLVASAADTSTPPNYSTVKVPMAKLGSRIVMSMTFPTGLQTTNPTIVGAINEVRGVFLTDTLEAGETTLTFTNNAITTNSTVEVFENVGAYIDIVSYSNIVVTTGQIVITFPAQATDLQVKVRVS